MSPWSWRMKRYEEIVVFWPRSQSIHRSSSCRRMRRCYVTLPNASRRKSWHLTSRRKKIARELFSEWTFQTFLTLGKYLDPIWDLWRNPESRKCHLERLHFSNRVSVVQAMDQKGAMSKEIVDAMFEQGLMGIEARWGLKIAQSANYYNSPQIPMFLFWKKMLQQTWISEGPCWHGWCRPGLYCCLFGHWRSGQSRSIRLSPHGRVNFCPSFWCLETLQSSLTRSHFSRAGAAPQYM